jgi:hypothetical protein
MLRESLRPGGMRGLEGFDAENMAFLGTHE